MHILIATNAFKNSLSALEAAEAIGQGLRASNLDCSVEYFPVGDGGDGTADLIIQKNNGSNIIVEVHDPLGRSIKASFGLIDNGNTAVIGLADASGLRLLQPQELAPLRATSFGTGELIKDALEKGVNKIILGIGGSATVDGGTGILQALGIRFLDPENKALKCLPQDLVNLASVDVSGADERIFKCELIILCDVDNTLLGEAGAANTFGRQKGATPGDVSKLEASLLQLRNVVLRQAGADMATLKYGGAAGGVAAGLGVFCKAQLFNGIDYFLTMTSFDEALRKADLVITGEGSIDTQTLQGKGPYGVAVKAKEMGVPVIGMAGQVPLHEDAQMRMFFDVLLAINNGPSALEDAMNFTKDNLIRTATATGNLLAMHFKPRQS